MSAQDDVQLTDEQQMQCLGIKRSYYPQAQQQAIEQAMREGIAIGLAARAQSAQENTIDAPVSAMQALRQALQADPEYAWAWHCNFAMPIMDSIHCTPAQANKAGADLMRYVFDIDIRKHEYWNHDPKPDEPMPAQDEREVGDA